MAQGSRLKAQGSRLELSFYFEVGKHRERAGMLVQNELHGEKYSNKAVQTDNLRAVCLVVSLSLNGTTRQTAHKLRLTAALECKTALYLKS